MIKMNEILMCVCVREYEVFCIFLINKTKLIYCIIRFLFVKLFIFFCFILLLFVYFVFRYFCVFVCYMLMVSTNCKFCRLMEVI